MTHDRAELKAQSAYRLSEAENAAHSYSVIGIDEGQFFPGKPLHFYASYILNTVADASDGMTPSRMSGCLAGLSHHAAYAVDRSAHAQSTECPC